MTLKYKIETKRVVDYSDLEEFILAIYGVEYEIVAMEEYSNDESHSYTVIKEELYQGDKQNIEKFKKNKAPQYMLSTILNDLCNNGHIEEGEYLINISW